MMDTLTNSLLIAVSIAQEVQATTLQSQNGGEKLAATLTNLDLAKILIIPVALWIIKGIIVYSFGRFHLIRHLYAEIELEVNALKPFHLDFKTWKRDNIDIQPPIPKSSMRLINFEPQLTYPVYHSSQSLIVTALWGKEIRKIHHLYSIFRDIQVLISNVTRGVRDAKDDFSIKRDNDFNLVEKETNHIITLIEELTISDSPRSIARARFYSLKIYLFPVAGIAVLIYTILALLRSL